MKLPEEDLAGALTAVANAAANEKLLERDVRAVDLRLPGKMVLQQNEAPEKKDNAKKQPAAVVRAGERRPSLRAMSEHLFGLLTPSIEAANG